MNSLRAGVLGGVAVRQSFDVIEWRSFIADLTSQSAGNSFG